MKNFNRSLVDAMSMLNDAQWSKNILDTARRVDKSYVTQPEINVFGNLTGKKVASPHSPTSYPPYNVKQLSDTSHLIEIALAGFSVSDINVDIEDSILVVSANKTVDEAEEPNYLVKGIANRAFVRRFATDTDIKVTSAEMVDGMLYIYLEKIVEVKKSTKIDIKTKSTPSFLND